MKNTYVNELINIAVEQEDQTQVQTYSGFDYEPPPAGKTVGRLIEYVELGMQPQKPYRGKPKDPAEMVRLTFELLAPKNIKEIEINNEKIRIADKISVTIKKSFSDKAKFKKLFDKMRYGREDIKHMAQCLNEGFIITIVHNTVKGVDGKPDRTYANITGEDGSFLIEAPFITDPIAETVTEVPVPEALTDVRIFLFNNPTKESWDSLFIDGDKTVKKEDGTEETVSKNWLQATIRGATNFAGSNLAALLEGAGELPDVTGALDGAGDGSEIQEDEDTPPAKELPVEASKAKAGASKPKTTAKAEKPAAVNPLTALGL